MHHDVWVLLSSRVLHVGQNGKGGCLFPEMGQWDEWADVPHAKWRGSFAALLPFVAPCRCVGARTVKPQTQLREQSGIVGQCLRHEKNYCSYLRSYARVPLCILLLFTFFNLLMQPFISLSNSAAEEIKQRPVDKSCVPQRRLHSAFISYVWSACSVSRQTQCTVCVCLE